nr:hypothetical protein [Micromonospora sp. DSM 115978]
MAIIGVLIAALGVLAGWLGPRLPIQRRLYYRLAYSAQILDARIADRPTISVFFGQNRELSNPYVSKLVVRNMGYTDIAREHFDGDEPIIFDMGAEIVEVVRSGSEISGGRVPTFSTSGDKLSVLPGLIPRRQEFYLVLLTEGAPSPGAPVHQLKNAVVKDGLKVKRRNERTSNALLSLGCVLLLVAVGIAILAGLFAPENWYTPTEELKTRDGGIINDISSWLVWGSLGAMAGALGLRGRARASNGDLDSDD